MESMVPNVNIHFYKRNTAKDTSIYKFSAYGSGHSDSLIYNNTSNQSFFQLPLDLTSDQSQFILEIIVFSDTIHVPDSCCPKDTVTAISFPDTIKIYTDTFRVVNRYKPYPETLIFSYTRELEMVSPECGFSYIIKLDSLWSTTNIIDSIFIQKTTIERGSNEDNIKIFL
jgi:hypothetical protein